MRFVFGLIAGLLPAAVLAQTAPSPVFKQVTIGAFTITGVGTTAGTVAAGNDGRITGAAQKANNLSDLPSLATALTNLGGAPLASPTFTGSPRAPTPPTIDNSTRIATTAWVAAQGFGAGTSAVTSVAGRTGAVSLSVGDVTGAAPLASPAFTGTPTTPTALSADSSTTVASTAFVKAQSYVNAAGAASAAPVQSVAGRTGAVTLTNSDVSGSAPTASPTFTGTPAAPTPLTSDNSTTIPTTAYVKAQGYVTSSGAAAAAPVQSVAGRTGAVTLTNSDVSGSAPLASPALTGTPTVPTAATSTNTTQAASTAFVLGQAATVAPLANGTAAVGTSALYARQDHVHPTDTTRAAASTTVTAGTGLTGGGDLTANRTVSIATNGITNSLLAQMAAGTVKANTTGATANAADVTPSAMLDASFGSTQGSVLYRGASAWTALGPGTSTQFLQSGGPAANPVWATPSGSGNVSGAASSTAGDIPTFADTTGKLLQDSGKVLPSGAIVGTTDTQTLTNKSISSSQITGLAASATTDTTNAANISSGTLPAARLPAPTASTLGGVQSIAAVSHNFLTSVTTAGIHTAAQPAAADISGLGTAATVNTGTSGGTIPLLSGANTWSGVQTHTSSGLVLSGATSGSSTLNAPATAGGVATLFPGSDTIVGVAATQTLTNKSIASTEVTGTATTDNASAGNIGEYIFSSIASASAVTITTTGVFNVTSISLSAGDWDVSGAVVYKQPGTTTFTFAYASTNTVTGNLGSLGINATALPLPGTAPSADFAIPTPINRYSLSTTTTVYLIADAAFATSTTAAYGVIRARRVR